MPQPDLLPDEEEPRDQVTSIRAREILGSVAVTPGAESVRVSLWINDLEVDHVAVPPSADGTGTFRFAVKDMWWYCGPGDRLTVRVGDSCLPMPTGGEHFEPSTPAHEPLTVLAERLRAGEIINSQGVLALPKYLDEEWQSTATELYQRVRIAVRELTGHDPFLVYGSLLGAVREGRPLGHDCDFDAGYLSSHTDPELVTGEAGELAVRLQERGFSVEARVTCIHIHDERLAQRIDLYHLYFDDRDELRLAFGAASAIPFRKDQWQGIEEITFGGAKVAVPRNAEDLVATFYGPHWRIPNPGFDWETERVTRAEEAYFPARLRPVINWQDHWLRTASETPTAFALFVRGLDLGTELTVDLGCGEGRDVPVVVRDGVRVLGLDRSPAAVASARRRRLLPEYARFAEWDAEIASSVRAALEHEGERRPRTLFYARQFLDAIPDEALALLLADLEVLARPGDAVAFEFRCVGDDTLTAHEEWNRGQHVVDPEPIRNWMAQAGFESVVDEASTAWESRGRAGVLLHRLVGAKP